MTWKEPKGRHQKLSWEVTSIRYTVVEVSVGVWFWFWGVWVCVCVSVVCVHLWVLVETWGQCWMPFLRCSLPSFSETESSLNTKIQPGWVTGQWLSGTCLPPPPEGQGYRPAWPCLAFTMHSGCPNSGHCTWMSDTLPNEPSCQSLA